MFCSSCGTELKEDAKFCKNCGKAVNTAGPINKQFNDDKANNQKNDYVPQNNNSKKIAMITIAVIAVIVIAAVFIPNIIGYMKNKKIADENIANASDEIYDSGNADNVGEVYEEPYKEEANNEDYDDLSKKAKLDNHQYIDENTRYAVYTSDEAELYIQKINEDLADGLFYEDLPIQFIFTDLNDDDIDEIIIGYFGGTSGFEGASHIYTMNDGMVERIDTNAADGNLMYFGRFIGDGYEKYFDDFSMDRIFNVSVYYNDGYPKYFIYTGYTRSDSEGYYTTYMINLTGTSFTSIEIGRFTVESGTIISSQMKADLFDDRPWIECPYEEYAYKLEEMMLNNFSTLGTHNTIYRQGDTVQDLLNIIRESVGGDDIFIRN